MKLYNLILAATSLFVSGCATNHLKQFYVDTAHESCIPKEFRNVQPDILFSDDLKADAAKAHDDGLTLVGYSNYWTSRPPTPKDLKAHATTVGATTVICQIHYRNSETRMKAMYNWVPGTTSTYSSSGYVNAQSTANFYGNGWYGTGQGYAQGNYYANATESTPGHLEYAGAMPVQIDYYNVGAVFLRKLANEEHASLSVTSDR
jgi:hypothetical protein